MNKLKLQQFEPEIKRLSASHTNRSPHKPTLIIAGTYDQFVGFCREFGLNRSQSIVSRTHAHLLDFDYVEYILSGADWERETFFVPPGHCQPKRAMGRIGLEHRLIDLRVDATSLPC